MKDTTVFQLMIIAVAIVVGCYIHGKAQIKIAVVNNCAKMAGEYIRFRVTNEGCQIGEWKVEP